MYNHKNTHAMARMNTWQEWIAADNEISLSLSHNLEGNDKWLSTG